MTKDLLFDELKVRLINQMSFNKGDEPNKELRQVARAAKNLVKLSYDSGEERKRWRAGQYEIVLDIAGDPLVVVNDREKGREIARLALQTYKRSVERYTAHEVVAFDEKSKTEF